MAQDPKNSLRRGRDLNSALSEPARCLLGPVACGLRALLTAFLPWCSRWTALSSPAGQPLLPCGNSRMESSVTEGLRRLQDLPPKKEKDLFSSPPGSDVRRARRVYVTIQSSESPGAS